MHAAVKSCVLHAGVEGSQRPQTAAPSVLLRSEKDLLVPEPVLEKAVHYHAGVCSTT